MKKQLQTLSVIASLALATNSAQAQSVASIENLTLTPNSYWNGATSNPTVSTSGTFMSGSTIFPNKYNGGGYWESGWAYSNMQDSTTVGYTNQYSARPAIGYNNSANYVVAQPGANGSVLKFNPNAQGKQMDGMYVTNGTFATLSMQQGDQFAKKFGGTTGNDPDWFKLKITKYLGGSLQVNDTVVFYLADFRFTNNTQDYIVKTWQYVDLKPLGNVDSLLFTLSSSDNSFGFMNTPSYFCMDNFTSLNAIATAIETNFLIDSDVTLFPNPAKDFLNVQLFAEESSVAKALEATTIELTNNLGQVVLSQVATIPQTIMQIGNLNSGVYTLNITSNGKRISKKIIKE